MYSKHIIQRSPTGQAPPEEYKLSDAEEEWGGDAQNCIGGPIRASSWSSNVSREDIGEIPVSQITSTWQSGMRNSFSVGPAFSGSISSHSVLPVANYFDGIEDFLFSNGVRNCDNCPSILFADSTKRNNATNYPRDFSIPTGYPYFTLSCLDSDFEVLHRVHLVIREWNTLQEFLTFQDTEGRSGDPDIEGSEGDECPYYEADEQIGSRTECNDFWDIDDITSRSHNERSVLQVTPCRDFGDPEDWLEYSCVKYE